ncbi:MAG: FAD-binding oxidoreductase [Marivita sp.]|uniref:FAD-binding oxidoreductase n=1 Tax=Marivita sp. TaxID=2003365 RepID=UPI003EF82B17
MPNVDIQATVTELQALLGDRLSTGASILDQHSHDEAYTPPVLPDAVAFPETTDEVSQILRICSKHGCPVVPYGVGTSLEGHIVPVQGGVSVDTSRMNAVIAINQSDLDAVVEPGVTRMQLNDALRASGLMFTVDPGADASLGGMAATRASGTNTVRYGTMADNVLALEVVLPDGQIIHTGSRARKSSTGYDLTHLFIGSEGTLGIITKLTVKLHGQPEHIAAATCAFPDIASAVETVILAIQMGLPLARIELLDEVQMRGMNIYNPDMTLPETPHLFLEFHGTEAGVAEQVESLASLVEDHGGSDFAWATKTEDRNRLWKARHEAYYAGKALRQGTEGVVTDCCVPISALAECIARTKELIADSGLMAPLVGHVGDGNFHLLILVDPDSTDEMARAGALANKVNMLALEFGGTVSGEHGIGLGKRKYLAQEHGAAYALMGVLKKAVDPGNIMNPGKLVTLN